MFVPLKKQSVDRPNTYNIDCPEGHRSLHRWSANRRLLVVVEVAESEDWVVKRSIKKVVFPLLNVVFLEQVES